MKRCLLSIVLILTSMIAISCNSSSKDVDMKNIETNYSTESATEKYNFAEPETKMDPSKDIMYWIGMTGDLEDSDKMTLEKYIDLYKETCNYAEQCYGMFDDSPDVSGMDLEWCDSRGYNSDGLATYYGMYNDEMGAIIPSAGYLVAINDIVSDTRYYFFKDAIDGKIRAVINDLNTEIINGGGYYSDDVANWITENTRFKSVSVQLNSTPITHFSPTTLSDKYDSVKILSAIRRYCERVMGDPEYYGIELEYGNKLTVYVSACEPGMTAADWDEEARKIADHFEASHILVGPANNYELALEICVPYNNEYKDAYEKYGEDHPENVCDYSFTEKTAEEWAEIQRLVTGLK